MPTAAVLTVGDELLLGRTVDTNRSWLSSELNRVGFRVVRGITVGDEVGAIEAAVRDLVGEAEVVVVTGGLGPTHDDLSRGALAAATGCTLVEAPEWAEVVRERFRARGFTELPGLNLSQALVPASGQWFPNRLGTAPGLLFPTGERWVVALPGVPREMRALFLEQVAPQFADRFAERLHPVFERYMRTSGISESVLAERIEVLGDRALEGCDLAFLPQLGGVDLRLTTRGEAVDAERRLERAQAVLREVVGPYRFGEGNIELADTVVDELVRRGLTIAVAESCTGGSVLERLTRRAGASQAIAGGVVAYDNRVKVRELGVQPSDLDVDGAVSESVALAMARGVRERFEVDLGVAITGVAGPGGGTEEKPVGTVWYAVDLRGGASARVERFPGDREAVRHRAGQAVLRMVLRALGEEERAGEPDP